MCPIFKVKSQTALEIVSYYLVAESRSIELHLAHAQDLGLQVEQITNTRKLYTLFSFQWAELPRRAQKLEDNS